MQAEFRSESIVSSHDPAWEVKFANEVGRIQSALGPNAVYIHHIGSTAIPNILAKPTIDILVEVSRIAEVDNRAGDMNKLNYESMGEFGVGGRRYFRSPGTDSHRAFHVHVFETGSTTALQHIAFRDYLLAHPEKAKEYSALKARLVKRDLASKTEYQDLKTPFVEACINDAMRWFREC